MTRSPSLADPRSPAIVLVYPKTGFDFGLGLAPPHAILALAAYLGGRGVPNPIVLLDQRVDPRWRGTLARALRDRPLLVGISSMTGTQLKHAVSIARTVRSLSPGTPIVLGGVHVSLLPEQTLRSEWFDLGIVGEGEVPLAALVEVLGRAGAPDLAGVPGLARREGAAVVVNPPADLPDLDELPADRLAGVDPEPYVFRDASLLSDRELDVGETSRGCPGRCGYCYNTVFHGGRWRGRSARAVVDLVRGHAERHRLKSLWLRDDNFFADPARAATVIEDVAGSGLGLYLPGIGIREFRRLPEVTLRAMSRMKGLQLRFGVESGSDRILGLVRKGIRTGEVYEANLECASRGLVPSYNFMVGFPGERWEDVISTVEMMKRLRRENPAARLNAVNLYTPYPGTELFDRWLAESPEAVPASVEGWATFHHLNLRRSGIARSARRAYENVATVSYLASDVFAASLSTRARRALSPIRRWFQARWDRNAFGVAPEVVLVRAAQRLLLSID